MSLSTNRQFGNCGLINCGNSFVSFEKVLLEQLFRGWQTFQILLFAAIRTMTSTILVQSFSRAYVASLTGTILHFFPHSGVPIQEIHVFVISSSSFPGIVRTNLMISSQLRGLPKQNGQSPASVSQSGLIRASPRFFSGFFFRNFIS